MSEVGEVIAAGRDTEIVDHGPGLVLRRPMVPRPMHREAAVMQWVHDQGYPCPTVHEVLDDGLVMDRIDGVSMLDDIVGHPHRMRRHATLMADLHGWLHQLPVPDRPAGASDGGPPLPELPNLFGPGTSLLHGDLHPGNILLTANGPVVIDWTNASVGPPGADVAVTWLLIAAAQPPTSFLERVPVAALRRLFVRAFLAATDRESAAGCLPAALEHRRRDANLTPAELAAMDRLVSRHRH
jgi:aminoglycoside phosphotransferase (APT) family kinase protein